jgi:pimeloyl-ACP methyl ester carboxylesterase
MFLTVREQLHGFTGSSAVWNRNIPALSKVYRVIAPDLRGHGDSGKAPSGHHVARLAMDLRNIIDALQLPKKNIRIIAGSLGCAIVWFVQALRKPILSICF